MKKIDEMERKIQLRSEELAYRTALLALSAWTLWNCCYTLLYDAEMNPLPSLILCLAVCVQGFSQIAIKQKMIAGDEEYHEPNKLLRTIIGAIVGIVLLLTIGTYFLIRV